MGEPPVLKLEVGFNRIENSSTRSTAQPACFDLLSDLKISSVHHAREDAKTTYACSVGTEAGGRRRTSLAGCIEAGHEGPAEANAKS